MKAEGLQIQVTVYYFRPGSQESGLAEWHGEIHNPEPEEWDWANKLFTVTGECETNIGKILLKNITEQHIAFTGSGDPKGPLAKDMGLNASE